jgi:hypothetical protein
LRELVREKRIEGISDLRDESDRDGMRMVIELKRDAHGEIVLNMLYQMTALQSTFGYNCLAIVGQRPKLLDLQARACCTSSTTAARWSRAARASTCGRPWRSASWSRASAWP